MFKSAVHVANRVDAASHLGLRRLLRPVCPNTYGIYGKHVNETQRHETYLRICVPREDSDQPAHMNTIFKIYLTIQFYGRWLFCFSFICSMGVVCHPS